MGQGQARGGLRADLGPELFKAIHKADAATVERLLTERADPNVRDDFDGSTPLIQAARVGNLRIVELLLKTGAQVNDHDLYGYSPLILAAQFGRGGPDTVQRLLGARADVHHQSKHLGETALTAAARSGHLEAVRSLVRVGAKLSHRTAGNTPLLAAAAGNHLPVLRWLLDLPEVDADAQNLDTGRSCLIWAAQHGNLEMMQALLTAGANISIRDDDRVSPFWVAQRHSLILNWLCRSNLVDTTVLEDGLSWLQLATLAGRPEAVQTLLETGSSLEYQEPQHGRTARQLLKHRADYWRPGWSREEGDQALRPEQAAAIQGPPGDIGARDPEIRKLLKDTTEERQTQLRSARLDPLLQAVLRCSSLPQVLGSLVVHAIQPGFPIKGY